MRILITGGAGLIGAALSNALVADGHEIIVLTRSPEKVRIARPASSWSSGMETPLLAGGNWQTALTPSSILPAKPLRSAGRKQRSRRSGRAVSMRQGSHGRDHGGGRASQSVLIQASAVGYYGTETGDAQVTESFSPGDDFLAKVCFDWEISTAAASKLGVRRPVLRTGIVLSTEGGALPQQLFPFKLFVGGPVGNGNQWYPWIHLDDEVRAIQFLLTNEQADGPFNLTAPNPVTNKEFGKLIGEAMGRPSVIPAPGFAMKSLFGDMSMLLLEGQRAVPQKLLGAGFRFKFDTAQAALRDLLGAKSEKTHAAKSAAKALAAGAAAPKQLSPKLATPRHLPPQPLLPETSVANDKKA